MVLLIGQVGLSPTGKYTLLGAPDQPCKIEALACEAPENSGRPISQWTAREIADEVIKRKIVDTISGRHAARLLKRC